MDKAVDPVFVSLALSGELVVPTTRVPKTSGLGESVTLVPVPLRLTTCGLVTSLSVMVRVSADSPVTAGVKVTLMRQLPAPITLPPQVEVWVKLLPVIEMLLITRSAVPKLLMVTVFTGLGLPIVCGGNFNSVVEAGEQFRTGRTSGAKGCCAKSNASCMSLVLASRKVSGARLKRSSTSFRKDENSYCV